MSADTPSTREEAEALVEIAPDSDLISTEFVFPPIPIRTFDWCAWYADDDEDPECPMVKGWGRTAAEARADLVDNFPRALTGGKP